MFWRSNRQGLAVVMLAFALVGGEVCGFVLPQAAAVWPWAACLAMFAMFSTVGWRIPYGVFAVVALAGLALALRTEYKRLAIESGVHRTGADGMPPWFDLKVENNAWRRSGARNGMWRISFDSKVGDIPVRVVAPLPQGKELPAIGEVWRCSGWLTAKKSAPSRYSRRKLWVVDGCRIRRVAQAEKWSAAAMYGRFVDELSRRAAMGLGWCPEIASLNRAMLLGRRADISPKKRAVFASAGTIHVFAISGLHVMLVAGLANSLLAKAGLSQCMRSVCAIPFLVAYVMLSGAHPSAVRAALMSSLWLGAGLFGRRPDSLAAWGHAALIVYGTAPQMVFDVGCAMSFVVMLGIVLWVRWSSRFASPMDVLLARAAEESALGDGTRALRFLWWHRKGTMLLGACGISCAAWVAGAPIAARVFGRLAFGGLVANIVVVPMAGLSVALGIAGMALSVIAPPLGALVNNLSAACTWMMERISVMVSLCPGASCETLPWSWVECGMWYVAWFALLALMARHLPPREHVSVKSWLQ